LISTDKDDYTTRGYCDARGEVSPRAAMENAVEIIDANLSKRKYTMNWLVEVAVPQTLFWKILARIRRLGFFTIPARRGDV